MTFVRSKEQKIRGMALVALAIAAPRAKNIRGEHNQPQPACVDAERVVIEVA